MRRHDIILWVVIAAASISFGCIEAPKVVQGTVASYDAGSQVVVVKDERAPNATLEISLAGGEVGADPEVGDEIRIAYRDDGGKLRALRVMNLTRQAEVGRKAGGSAGGH